MKRDINERNLDLVGDLRTANLMTKRCLRQAGLLAFPRWIRCKSGGARVLESNLARNTVCYV